MFRRATALLPLNQGATLVTTAQSVKVAEQSVMRWRDTYQVSGLQFLFEQKRSGRPHKFDGFQRARLTALACSAPPEGHARWSLGLLADRAVELNLCDNISKSTVRAVLKKSTPAALEKVVVHWRDDGGIFSQNGEDLMALQST